MARPDPASLFEGRPQGAAHGDGRAEVGPARGDWRGCGDERGATAVVLHCERRVKGCQTSNSGVDIIEGACDSSTFGVGEGRR